VTTVGEWLQALAERVQLSEQSVTALQEQSNSQLVQTTALAAQLRTHEETFTEPDKLPALFKLVVALAEVVNGQVHGSPGAGLDKRILEVLATQAAAGTQLPAPPSGSGFAGFSIPLGRQPPGLPVPIPDSRVTAMEVRLQRLEMVLASAGAAPAAPPPPGGSGL
jgi:hypothetical protein